MRLAWAFFKRDAIMALSYRATFAAQLAGNLVLLCLFYYIGRTVGPQSIPALEKYGGSFLAFFLVGIALTDCVGVSLTAFSKQIREGQLTGSLEATLMSPVPLPVILLMSSLWPYFLSAFRFVMYLSLGMLLYRVDLAHANLLSALVLFVLTVLCFAGLGILWASVVMVVQQVEPIITVGALIVLLLSGVVFPSSVLPVWLQHVAALIPLTHALDGMRHALLQGYNLGQLAGVAWTLIGFAVVFLAAGLGSFGLAVGYAKRAGTLTRF
ncbi:MAG: ABC transporter permease [Candidatus Eisenbacteria bacterium]|nr:ABC transporter permease [Candidatus Eisenbacteria bacterium]